MTYEQMVIKLKTVTPSKELFQELYTFMLPILQELKCRKISLRQQDHRLVQIFNGAFRTYWNVLHQHPASYWERLLLFGPQKDFEEFACLKRRKTELREVWKRTFAPVKRATSKTVE